MARVLHVSLAQPLLTATRALIPRVKIFSLGCDFRLLHMVAALPAQRVGACKPCIHRHSLKHGDFHISSAGCPQRTGHRKRIGGPRRIHGHKPTAPWCIGVANLMPHTETRCFAAQLGKNAACQRPGNIGALGTMRRTLSGIPHQCQVFGSGKPRALVTARRREYHTCRAWP